MQAPADPAVTGARGNGTDYLSHADTCAERDVGLHRLIGRSNLAVVDHHDTPASQLGREGDDS
jgi:hypothetical protein